MSSVETAAAKRTDEAVANGLLSGSAAANIKRWLVEPPFRNYRDKLVSDLNEGRWRQLDDAFYAVLEFGTGGRRGRMYPVGTNVLNQRTIAESARGLADYLIGRKGSSDGLSCVIAHDPRHQSPEFAELCARVLAAAGFKTYLFEGERSTPLLSFAVRHLKCDAGIMITASHNPPSDNGFKCYASTGGQVVPPDDAGIIACVKAASDREIPEKSREEALADGSLVLAGEEVDAAYIAAVVAESVGDARDLSIVYTPLHGAGETSVYRALRAAGFDRVEVLAEQRRPDGDFPNVPGHVSNPEIPKTLSASIDRARKSGATLVLASDPDADRIGAAVPTSGDPEGDWTAFDGNRIGALLAAFVIERTKEAGKLRPEHYLATTLVTTEMAKAIAARAGIRTEDDLPVGFKWIGLRIDEAGPENFLFGFEESHGYLKGTYARDKDAAVASLLFAELTAELKRQNKTVPDYLDDLYLSVGHYGERLINKTMEGREGAAEIKKLMTAFRERPPKTIAGLEVIEAADYGRHELRNLRVGKVSPLPRPSSDLLIFRLDAPGVRFAARPSGTEPKIKFYLFARTETQGVSGKEELAEVKRRTADVLERMGVDIERYVAEALS